MKGSRKMGKWDSTKAGKAYHSKYINEYQKKNFKRIEFKLRKIDEADIIDWLDKQPSKQAYIKKLIKDDMKKK